LPLPALGADKFAEIVKLRNKLAGVAGYQNYYDMKLQQAEGFTLQVGHGGGAVGLRREWIAGLLREWGDVMAAWPCTGDATGSKEYRRQGLSNAILSPTSSPAGPV
jgi:hypothetical protein